MFYGFRNDPRRDPSSNNTTFDRNVSHSPHRTRQKHNIILLNVCPDSDYRRPSWYINIPLVIECLCFAELMKTKHVRIHRKGHLANVSPSSDYHFIINSFFKTFFLFRHYVASPRPLQSSTTIYFVPNIYCLICVRSVALFIYNSRIR